ncbi:hypothetical protein ACHAXA_005480 [Cyclostephanos tholiformis]|uniref:Ammonium transporter n=1 Tax=Cyclostephanos tholiformis TaxID=382380 RepID=A0ABD3SHD3_9STRA
MVYVSTMATDGITSTYQTCLSDLTALSINGTTTPTTDALLLCISNTFDAANTGTENSIDTFFLLYAASLVFFMQTGFAMISAGCVRINNVQNTLLKNLLDACGAAFGWYTVGYAFAYGRDPDETETTFIGNNDFVLMGVESNSFWLFQLAFAATSTTIVAGALAERCQMTAYLAYSVVLSAFVYPVVVHAIWSPTGFLNHYNLNPLFGSGMIDFAGGAVVHITGGTTALIAAIILGPRTMRFYDLAGRLLDEPTEMPGHSLSLQCLGTFILWFGWYGFNAGSIIYITEDDNYLAVPHIIINCTLAASAGCITALFLSTYISERLTGEVSFNLQYTMNGCLSGLVAITPACAVVDNWASIVIGLVAGALYLGGSKLIVKRRIDDAVDAIPVHLTNGIWGCISVGLFADPTWVNKIYHNSTHVGWFYSWGRGSADGTLLACQLVGILFVIGWVMATMIPFFSLLHWWGFLRADPLEEIVGLDIGYTGAIYKNRENKVDVHDELEAKMPEYLEEYKNRREEKALLVKAKTETRQGVLAPIPASSVHNPSIHGSSYHGRKVVTAFESLDCSSDRMSANLNLDESRASAASATSRKSESRSLR